MEKIIKLKGRIDTTNADEIEKSLDKEIGNFKGQIILDAEELEYISSAGLRIILRLKKKNEFTKVINCSLELYEIFHMTGFTKMIEVTKKMRNISVDGCDIIGVGFYGSVYRIDSETIVKVYKKGVSLDVVKHEIDLAQKAFLLGIPTAIAYDIVKVGDLYGSVFELIDASSLQELIVDGADIDKLVKEIVEVLKIIHSTEITSGELPSIKDEKIKYVKDCEKLLPKETTKKLMELIKKVPDTNTMLHGDFHIKNIMKQKDEIVLVDMNTLSVGHPIFEFGAMFATYIGFASVDKDNIKKFLGIEREQAERIFNLTCKYYFKGKKEKEIEEIVNKAKIISYLQILWIRSKYKDSGDEICENDIKFASEYLTENVDKIDSLDF